MRVGKLRNTVQIDVPGAQTGTDEAGHPIYANAGWGDAIYCAVKWLRGRETLDKQGNQRFSRAVIQFTVRRSEIEGVDTANKILFEGQEYDIHAILPDDQYKSDAIIECMIFDGEVTSAA